MKYLSLIATVSIIGCSLAGLTQCTSSVLGSSPQVVGSLLTDYEKKKIDRELESVYEMRDKLTSTAYEFQTERKDKGAELKIAEAKYVLARKDLGVLREHLVKRLEVGKSYTVPSSAEVAFQDSGNDFLNYYKTVTENTKFGSALLVGIGLIYNWNDMLVSKQAAVVEHVKSQLQLDDWKKITR